MIPNGVDCDRWTYGDGGAGVAWSGRITPEKAPAPRHRRSTPSPDDASCWQGLSATSDYFDAQLLPRLGADAVYAGHLAQRELSRLLRHSAALVASPVWDEPYGLVVAEALASGTPVAAFRRGGIPEVVDARCGALASNPATSHPWPRAIDTAVRPGSSCGTTTCRATLFDRHDGRQLREPAVRHRGRVIGYYVHHHGQGHLVRAGVASPPYRTSR